MDMDDSFPGSDDRSGGDLELFRFQQGVREVCQKAGGDHAAQQVFPAHGASSSDLFAEAHIKERQREEQNGYGDGDQVQHDY
jgi:hypothetical protein